MPTLQEVMHNLESKCSEKTRITYARHGMPIDRMFGASNADLKLIAKTIKREQALAMELYASGKLDAMYLAGLVADGAQMTWKQLQSWTDGAAGMHMIYEYPVSWVTVESEHGPDLAALWVKSTMNKYVILVGSYVKPLYAQAKATGKRLGAVAVDVGDTDCKIPFATEYIEKAKAAGKLGRKKKTIRC